MAYKEVKSGNFFPFAEVGDCIEGVYIRSEEGQNGDINYEIETKKGEKFLIGATVLRTKFKNIKPGAKVRVTYTGNEISKKMKKPYKDFKVEIDE